MSNVVNDKLRALVADKLQVNEFELVDVLLDTAAEYLIDLLGLDNADEADRFMAMPCFWVWFRQTWTNNDMCFVNAVRLRPELLICMKGSNIELKAYKRFHKQALKGKRPVGEIMRAFGKLVYDSQKSNSFATA
jgi:hypothetical protein